ncbi:sensor histidine kinase [Bacillus sp. AK128]
MTNINVQTLSEVINSFESDSKRISNELHEGIAQTLYSVYTGLQFIEAKSKDEEVGKQLKQMARMIERSIDDLRWLATDLHPPSMDVYGVYSALKAYVNIFIKTFGIEVLVHSVGQEVRLTDFTEKLLFRNCQEILKILGQYPETEEITIIFDWDLKNLIISFHIKGLNEEIVNLEVETVKVKAKAQLIQGEVKQRVINPMEIVLTIDVPYPIEVNRRDQDSISG